MLDFETNKKNAVTTVESMPNRTDSENFEDLIFEGDQKELGLAYVLRVLSMGPSKYVYRTLLLNGPSGTGKTTMARGLASEAAKIAGLRVGFVEISAQSIFDEGLGGSQKNLKEALETTKKAIGQFDKVILDVEEVDGLMTSREQSYQAREPGDVSRVVNILNIFLDEQKRKADVVTICTTNFAAHLDLAFMNRADLCIDFELPGAGAREQVIRKTLSEWPGSNVKVQVDVLGKASEGLSPRQLVRIPLICELLTKGMSTEGCLRAIKRIKGENNGNESIGSGL